MTQQRNGGGTNTNYNSFDQASDFEREVYQRMQQSSHYQHPEDLSIGHFYQHHNH